LFREFRGEDELIVLPVSHNADLFREFRGEDELIVLPVSHDDLFREFRGEDELIVLPVSSLTMLTCSGSFEGRIS
jgi:hypothetical protein